MPLPRFNLMQQENNLPGKMSPLRPQWHYCYIGLTATLMEFEAYSTGLILACYCDAGQDVPVWEKLWTEGKLLLSLNSTMSHLLLSIFMVIPRDRCSS